MERMMSFGEIPVRRTNPADAAAIRRNAETLFAMREINSLTT
jgi:hypothetical protein